MQRVRRRHGNESGTRLQLRSEKFRKVEVGSRIVLLNLGTDTKQDGKGRDREAELSNREGQGKHYLQNISL